MKKKISFIFLFLLAFTFLGTLSFFDLNSKVYAESTTASTWDGNYVSNSGLLTADDWHEDTSTGRYYIRSAKGFSYFAYLVNNGYYFNNKKIYLETDIDLDSHSFIPVGVDGAYFNGAFYGQEHFIYNLNIDADYSYAGLFGLLSGSSSVSDLHLRDVMANVNTSKVSYFGALAGKTTGQISQCSAEGSVVVADDGSGGDDYIGGLIGEYNSAKILTRSYSDVNIIFSSNANASTLYVGGVVGSISGTMQQVFSTGSISAFRGFVGGIAGWVYGTRANSISNSYSICAISVANTGSVNARVGGLVGLVSSAKFDLSTCYYAGDIMLAKENTAFRGGLIATIDDSNATLTYSISLADSFVIWNYELDTNGDVFFNQSAAKAISTTNLYCNDLAYSNETANTSKGTCVVEIEKLARANSWYGSTRYWSSASKWNLSNMWNISGSQNDGLPFLRYANNISNADNDQNYSLTTDEFGNTIFEGEGTAQSPFQIKTAGDLGWLSFNYNSKSEFVSDDSSIETYQDFFKGKYFALQNDIDLSGKSWNPIGSYEDPFTGVFDGNNYSIFGMTCSLQETHSFHGLFGAVRDAVIKNLTVSNSKFINPGTGVVDGATFDNTYGVLVGIAMGDFYHINCKATDNFDESGDPVLNVGYLHEDCNFYMVYGIKNSQSGNWVLNNDTFVMTKEQLQKATIGYDVTIDGRGGDVYSAEEELYLGQYHILVGEDGSVIYVLDYQNDDPSQPSGATYIDESYGQTLLPGLSTTLYDESAKGDFIVNKGYKLSGYNYTSDNTQAAVVNADGTTSLVDSEGNVTSVLNMDKKPIQGLYAVYRRAGYNDDGTIDESTATKVKVIFNSYEKSNFASQTTQYSSSTPWQVDEDGNVFMYYYYEFDSTLFENRSLIASNMTIVQPSYTTGGDTIYLRNGDFLVEGIYQDQAFANNILDIAKTSRVNREQTYYAKWVGSGERYQLNLNLLKSQEGEQGKFELVDAIERVELTKYKNGRQNVTVISEEGLARFLQTGNIVSLEYDTTYSDTVENYINVNVVLKNGYMFERTSSAGDFKTSYTYDANFGTLNYEFLGGWITDAATGLELNSRALKSKNMVGDYTFDLEVRRIEQTFGIQIGHGVRFGVSPQEESVANVYVYNGNQFVLLDGYKSAVGFDIVNGTLLSQDERYDEKDLPNGALSNNQIVFKYEHTEASAMSNSYYLYEIAEEDQTKTVSVYSLAGFDEGTKSWTDQKHLVSIEYKNGLLVARYYTNSTFDFIFSTESDESIFKTLSPTTATAVDFELHSLKTIVIDEAERTTKALMKFNNIRQLMKPKYSSVGGDTVVTGYDLIDIVEAITTYTKAVFTFEAVDRDGNVIDRNRPVVSALVTEVLADGQIVFDIESTEYFKFVDNSLTVALWEVNSEFFNLKLRVENPNTTNADFKNQFNNVSNISYFTNANVEFLAKGTNSDYDNDVYRITLSFASSSNTYGLQAGYYVVQFVCEDVLYSIDYAPKFIESDIADENILNNMTDEENSQVTAEVLVGGTDYESGTLSIKYGDEITLNTTLGSNHGYEFYKWIVVQNNAGEKIYSFVEGTEISRNLYDLNAQDDLTGEERYGVEIYPIYKRKNATVELSDQFVIYDNNGRAEEKYKNNNYGIKLHGESEGNFEFDYTTSDSQDAKLSSIYLSKEEVAKGYYFAGMKVLYNGIQINEDSQLIESWNKDDLSLSAYSLLDLVKGFFENGFDGEYADLEGTISIMPILRQKTAEIYFHSGTGDDSNIYGDALDGIVSNRTSDITTEKVYFAEKTYLDQAIYLYNRQNLKDVSTGELELIALDDQYFGRVGYSKPNQNYWKYEIETSSGTKTGAIPTSTIDLTSAYFEADDDIHVEIHFYRYWEATQDFYVNFDANGGEVAQTQDAFYTTKYDEIFAKQEDVLKISRATTKIGYRLVGWTFERNGTEYLFDDLTSGNLTEDIARVYIENRYKVAEDITVYAKWEECPYKIKLDFNSANSISIDGVAVETEDDFVEFELDYDTTFAEIIYNFDTISISDISATRFGFEFNGIYAVLGSDILRIDNNTVFNVDLLSVDLQATPYALIVYVGWTIDEDALSLEFDTNRYDSIVYDGVSHTYSLAQMFAAENVTAEGYLVDVDGTTLSILLPETMGSTLSALATSTKTTVSPDFMFGVENAGIYAIDLTLTVTDNARVLNLGVVSSQMYSFEIEVRKAQLNTDVESVITSNLKLLNLKRIVRPYVKASDSLLSAESLNVFIALMTNADGTLVGATLDEAYQYLMTKYYFMTHTNTEDYNTFKAWTYADYQSYKTQNLEECDEIVRKTYFFDNYNVFNSEKSLEDWTDLYSANGTLALQILSGEQAAIEVMASKVEARPTRIYLSALTNATTRIYLEGVGVSNYQTLIDSEGKNYIEIASGYIMPQIQTVEISAEEKSVYYNEDVQKIEIDWSENLVSQTIGTEIYYQIADDTYLQATLYTSTTGNKDQQTDYSWTDGQNYFYFDDVRVSILVGLDYYDVTNYVKLTVDENDMYSVLATKGLAMINLGARYYTYDDDGYGRREITSETQLLKIVEVDYEIEGVSKQSYNSGNALEEGAFYDPGTGNRIYQIFANNKNDVSIIATELVVSIKFALDTKYISDYIVFQNWTSKEINEVLDSLEEDSSLTLELDFSEADKISVAASNGETLEGSNASLYKVDFFAIFTDLVKVKYDLNFPASIDTSFADTKTIKLGASTIDDLPLPTQRGFKILKLQAVMTDGSKVDYAQLFTNEVYQGFDQSSPTARHKVLNIDVTWEMDDIDYVKIVDEVCQHSVLNFSSLSASDILIVTNKNTDYFTYEYLWEREISGVWTVLSQEEVLTLARNGSASESGKYRLSIVAKVNNDFIYAGTVEEGNSTKSVSVEFELVFNKFKAISFDYTDTTTTTTYNANNQISVWGIVFDYQMFDSVDLTYTNFQQTLYYVAQGSVYFTVEHNSQQVFEMIDAGVYTVTAHFDEDVYDLSGFVGETQFEFTITAQNFDLSAYNFALSKSFNQTDGAIEGQIFVSGNVINLQFSRDAGEDVGQYNLYFKDTTQETKTNINYFMGDVALFENGILTEAASTTVIGTFSINASAKLCLSYEVSADMPYVVEVDYDDAGYTAQITNDFVLQIFKGGTLVESANLRLYDSTQNQYVENEEILDLLKTAFAGVETKFLATEVLDRAVDSALYKYYLQLDDAIKSYYSAVEFESDFMFKINSRLVDVEDLILTKVYDSTPNQYFDFSGNEILDLTSFSGVYIAATYNTVHVATDVRVSLSVASKNYDGNVSNYKLSESSALGQIVKRSATMKISGKKSSFVYGEVTLYDIAETTVFVIEDENGNDITSWLTEGFYNLALSINASANDKGFVYAGEYQILASASFQDFDMTLDCSTILIEKYTAAYNISEGYITVEAGSTILESYERELTIAQTGDVITANFVVEGLTVGQGAAVGEYDLSLMTTLFKNNSIELTINADNKGFVVVLSTQTLYVRFEDESILSHEYIGATYTLSADAGSKTFAVSNGTTNTTNLLTFTKNESGVETQVGETLTSVSICLSSNETTVSAVGNYRLYLTATSENYSAIVFAEEYYFEITKISINMSKYNIIKEYDGDKNLIVDFDEKLVGDDVSLLARFDDSIVGTTTGAFFLTGTSSGNYQLSTATFTNGEITKAIATISLTKTEYVYGEMSSVDKLQYSVVAANGNYVIADQYSIELEIENAAYSESSYEYLNVGAYDVKLKAYTSNNYVLYYTTTRISVSAYKWNLSLLTNGEVKHQYGTTESKTNNFVYTTISPLYEEVEMTLYRQSGFAIGYYKVESAETDNPNYEIVVEDKSDEGFYRIIKADDIVYMLISDEETIDATVARNGAEFEIEYDSNIYDVATIEEIESENYLVLSSTHNANANLKIKLTAYYYDVANQVYTKANQFVSDLKANVSILNSQNVKNVGSYRMQSSSVSSSSYEVRLGRAGDIYSFYFAIVERQLYFREEILSKVFDNKDAIMTYEDASQLVDRIVEGETFGLQVTFKRAGAIAKYYGENFTVEASLLGNGVENYNLNICLEDGTVTKGKIDKAELVVCADSQAFLYGQVIYDGSTGKFNHDINATYQTDFDMTGYDASRLTLEITINADQSNVSASGALNVGEYSANIIFNSPDFKIAKFVFDKTEYEWDDLASRLGNLPVNILVSEKVLTMTATDTALVEVFTKTYDGTKHVVISDASGLLFDVTGIIAGDDVALTAANYASEYVGESIQIDFELSGADKNNYVIEPWLFGVINPIVVGLNFEYPDGAQSDVVANGLQEISTLAYPFMSASYLTANSGVATTSNIKNFPNAPLRTGYTFKNWTMKFEGLDSEALAYLDNLVSRLNMQSSYDSSDYVVVVDNGEKTVRFLNALIGEDVDNLLGYYYKENPNLEVTFTSVDDASWETNKYSVRISQSDESGRTAALGTVSVNDSPVETPLSVEVLYGGQLKLQVSANEHCYLEGIYVDGESYTESAHPNITWDNQTKILYFSSVTRGYIVDFRFAIQKVNLVIDTNADQQIRVDSANFTKLENENWQWSTDYLALEGLYLSEISSAISKLGYRLTSLNSIDESEFETTTILSQISTSQDRELTVTFALDFEAVGIAVVLDYGYDGITQELVVPFNSAYNTAAGWEETPLREGHEFAGWYDENGNQVLGEQTVEKTEIHTLTASWTANKYSILFTVTNASIQNANITFETSENRYFAEDVEYGTTISFDVVASAGYEVDDNWGELFEVTKNNDGSASISFEVPAQDVEFDIPVSGKKNVVSVLGENIAEVNVFVNGVPVTVSEKTFEVTTGETVSIEVSATLGFAMLDEILLSDENIQVSGCVVIDDVLYVQLKNITQDFSMTCSTYELINKLAFEFDNVDVFDWIEVDGLTYTDFNNISEFDVRTNQTFEFYLAFYHGFDVDLLQSEEYEISYEKVTEGAYEGCYFVTVENIFSDGTISITSKKATYTITVEVVAFDENKQEVENTENKAYVNGQTSIEVEYESFVSLTQQAATLFSFVGWSTDRLSTFDMSASLNYQVNQNQTIYAIFSTLKFTITLKTLDYYTVGGEYGEANKTDVYKPINAIFKDSDTNAVLSTFDVYYGAAQNVTFQVPNGYTYYGYGFIEGEQFVYISTDAKSDREIKINISSYALDEEKPELTLYFVVNAYAININFDTKIDIDDVYEENTGVGKIQIQSNKGENVNAYGYIENTRVHYLPDSFANGELLDDKAFKVGAFTGDEIYIKITPIKEGYKFYGIVCDDARIIKTKVSQTNSEVVYRLTNLIGGSDCNVTVLFKPTINTINLSFEKDELFANAGVFVISTTGSNAIKVWTSGQEQASVQVSAYTDSTFEVAAYIKAGYQVDPNNLSIIDDSALIEKDSVRYQEMSIQNTGFVAKISFVVTGYLGANEIVVNVETTQYTVLLKEDETTLVKIKNVDFDSYLNLSQTNSENITVFDDRIKYFGGELQVGLPKDDHNFEGYFTYQNGAGVRYIDSNAKASNLWAESGYVFNQKTNKYELIQNAYVDPETNQIVVSLYIYWSYYKTRISFEFVPGTLDSHTAQEMISGVDWSNSWYYPTSPNYIEVAFNTDIRIVAPEIEGYKFFKYVISQKNADGTWLSDVVAYTEDIPWSTNDIDKIVECKIKVVYFAQIEVVVFGGEGKFVISQEYTESQAIAMLEGGYVDTTKEFAIEAMPGDGYEFVKWTNYSNGQTTFAAKLENLKVSQVTKYQMTLRGFSATLSFEYDPTFGQIHTVIAQSKDNSQVVHNLRLPTAITSPQISVGVGDVLTFIVKADYGFAVSWNRTDIEFLEYIGNNTYYFEMEVLPTDAGRTVVITPTFEDEVLSIYIDAKFVDEDIVDDALDINDADRAGYVELNGMKTTFVAVERGDDVILQTKTFERYRIVNIYIENYGRVIECFENIFNERNQIVLSRGFIQENGILGTLRIVVEFERKMWIEQAVEPFEGRGTARNPYEIETVFDLAMMMQLVNSGATNADGEKYADCHYKLVSDLKLEENFWTPIGTKENPFNGTFDFNEHSVSGIYLARVFQPLNYNGLFGELGPNVRFISTGVSLWYIYLIVAIFVVVIVIIVTLIVISRKSKKRRELLANK